MKGQSPFRIRCPGTKGRFVVDIRRFVVDIRRFVVDIRRFVGWLFSGQLP